MREVELGLGGCSFLHRRSQIHLLTETIVSISCEDERVDVSSDEVPLQSHFSSWFPRSQNLVWLLRLSFADDIDSNMLDCQDVRRVIADHLADAEVSDPGVDLTDPDASSYGESSGMIRVTHSCRLHRT